MRFKEFQKQDYWKWKVSLEVLPNVVTIQVYQGFSVTPVGISGTDQKFIYPFLGRNGDTVTKMSPESAIVVWKFVICSHWQVEPLTRTTEDDNSARFIFSPRLSPHIPWSSTASELIKLCERTRSGWQNHNFEFLCTCRRWSSALCKHGTLLFV